MQMAWFAGFFDGEGCVRIDKVRGGLAYGLSVSISNTYHPSLIVYEQTFGGHISNSKTRPGRQHKRLWEWNANGVTAYNFLVAIEPYMLVKKEQANIAIEYYKLYGNRPGPHGRTDRDKVLQESYFQRLSKLKLSNGFDNVEVITEDKEEDNTPQQLRLLG